MLTRTPSDGSADEVLPQVVKEVHREEQGQPTRKAEAEARTATVSQLDREQDEAVEQLRALHKAELDDVISELQA